MKAKTVFLVFIVFSTFALSQVEISIGGNLGGGSFSGNSTSIDGFNLNLFVEANIPIFSEVFPRAGFIFIKDYNAIIPNSTQPYNPFLTGAYFKGITTQYFDNKIFLEEGVGLLALNDQTFVDTDVWDYGVVLSITAGFDLRDFDLKGFKLGAGVEYGITFFNTLPEYYNLSVQVHYTLWLRNFNFCILKPITANLTWVNHNGL